MSEWQNTFTKYATGTAFNISLSPDQASLLAHIATGWDGSRWANHSGRDSFFTTFRALKRRGLAEHNPAAEFVGVRHPGVKLKWVYRLTPAGHHVLALLRLSGVVDDDAQPPVDANNSTPARVEAS